MEVGTISHSLFYSLHNVYVKSVQHNMVRQTQYLRIYVQVKIIITECGI